MLTIYKYPIQITDTQTLQVPLLGVFMDVQMQELQACLWARVDPEQPLRPRIIRVVGTGHCIDFLIEDYIGTFQNPPFVWHVFEERSL